MLFRRHLMVFCLVLCSLETLHCPYEICCVCVLALSGHESVWQYPDITVTSVVCHVCSNLDGFSKRTIAWSNMICSSLMPWPILPFQIQNQIKERKWQGSYMTGCLFHWFNVTNCFRISVYFYSLEICKTPCWSRCTSWILIRDPMTLNQIFKIRFLNNSNQNCAVNRIIGRWKVKCFHSQMSQFLLHKHSSHSIWAMQSNRKQQNTSVIISRF